MVELDSSSRKTLVSSQSTSEEGTQIQTTSSWEGVLQLVFAQRHRGTQIIQADVQAPLKFQRPFYPEGPEVCHGVMLHTAGGVVGGDRLTYDVALQSNAHALLTTAAAAKIYRSTGQIADQTVHLTVAEQACLEWLPQETILFDGACYQQNMRVDLAENALWLGWDIIRLGRSARGETFNTGQWRSHTEVWQANTPLWIDPQWVQGGSKMMTSPQGLAGRPVVGSLVLIGRPVSQASLDKARALWTPTSQAEAGVTRLISGLLCRYRGHSTTEARRWFTQVWDVLRQEMLMRPSCIPRAWLV
jgi:urease accessory protein